MHYRYLLLAMLIAFQYACLPGLCQSTAGNDEAWRPVLHFSSQKGWINDPNGMVYHKGVYHLFFQHYPDGNQWGPMHWGHATSRDLVYWEEKSIKLYPDSLGYIFSGSAVFDSLNTSGLGTLANPPLVAIFTHHDPKTEKTTQTFQNQSLAYSIDSGHTWTKYDGNPVLKNPGIADFRDPKVIWHDPSKKWIMTLAVKDRIHFYASANLKVWTRLSEFGQTLGAHGGVWECPDLFPMQLDGKTHWVLLVNLNPGGPNGGSATQYFIGDFDGRAFNTTQTDTRWLDYGPDEYAGVTWSNTGDKTYFIGWMSNWDYANQLPTQGWRNAMTLTRELSLQRAGNEIRIASLPVPAYQKFIQKEPGISFKKGEKRFTVEVGKAAGKALEISWEAAGNRSFSCIFENSLQERIIVGYNAVEKNFYIDRSASGNTGNASNFKRSIRAPRIGRSGYMKIRLVLDASSLELFADDGLTVMTTLLFPSDKMNKFMLEGDPGESFRGFAWGSFRHR